MSKLVVHATTVSYLLGDTWHGVLVSGPSGVGKSDLALRAMAHGFALISDDYSILWESSGYIFATAPDTIKDRIEVRGIGIVGINTRRFSRISLHVQCQNTAIERLPEREVTTILGRPIPTLRLDPRESACVAKVLISLRQTVQSAPRGLD